MNVLLPPRSALRLACLPLLAALALPGAGLAQDFRILHAELSPDGRAVVRVPANQDRYYILYRGNDVHTIQTPVALQLGGQGNASLAESIGAVGETARFYRVREVSVRQPADSDLDGLDDLFELQRSSFLNPLDPADAARDFDGDGKTNLQEYSAGADPAGRPPSEVRPPFITLSSPLGETSIAAPVDVVGQIMDETLVTSYTIEAARSDLVPEDDPNSENSNWKVLTTLRPAPGTKTVDGVLARFDPTRLENGEYFVRVRASDGANRGAAMVRVHVTGALKIGYARLGFTDLEIPLPGMPIKIRRVYDSRNAGKVGDFGYGWSLGDVAGNVLETRKKEVADLFGETSFTLTKDSRIYLTLPDGQRVGFTFTPTDPRGSLFGTLYKPAYTADPGVFFQLEPLDENAKSITQVAVKPDGSVGLPLFAWFNYDPSEWRLIGKDGTTYDYSDTEGLRRVKDRVGNTLTFTRTRILHSSGRSVDLRRDADGRITEVVGPEGATVRYTYDARGDLASITDLAGKVTRFEYHTALPHHLRRATDSAEKVLALAEYDARGGLLAFTGPATAFQEVFDSDTRMGTYTDGNGNITRLYYDDRGNLIRKVDPLEATTWYAYDARNQVTNVVNARGHATALGYDDRGNLIRIVDPLGHVSRLEYNALNKPTRIEDALGAVTVIAYDPAGHPTRLTNALGDSQSWEYDASGRMVAATDFNGHRTEYRYETGCPCGLPGEVIHPDGTRRTYQYNAFGHVTRTVDETGRATTLEYDSRGNLLTQRDPGGGLTRYTYTGDRIASISDPLGRTRRREYDDLGRVVREIDPAGGVTQFTHDAAGNRTSITDAVGNVTRFVYDAANRLVEQIDPLGQSTTHEYDALGNRISTLDRNGRRRTFDYDPMRRMTREKWWLGQELIRTLEFGYDAVGNRISAADPESTLTWIYDVLHRVTTVTQTGYPGSVPFRLTYTYDPSGNTLAVVDQRGVSVRSAYDNRSRLARRWWEGTDPLRVDFEYDSAGRQTGLGRYNDAAGTQRAGSTTWEYTPAGPIASIVHRDAVGAPTLSIRYERDLAMQIVGRTINGVATRYEYDRNGQLVSALPSDGVPERFQYDAVGNRTGGDYATSAGNRLVSGAGKTFTFDPEGNRITNLDKSTGEVTEYAYDHRNRLRSIRIRRVENPLLRETDYRYDSIDRLIRAADSADVRFTGFDAERVWSDLYEDGNVKRRYLLGVDDDNLLSGSGPKGDPVWYHSDNLYSVLTMADGLGGAAEERRYAAFGLPNSGSAGRDSSRHQFIGRDYEAVNRLYWFRRRNYDPAVGRFLQEDPLGFEAGDWNLYRYSGNNPLSSRDPGGQQAAVEFVLVLCTVMTAVSFGVSHGEAVSGLYADLGIALDRAMQGLPVDSGGMLDRFRQRLGSTVIGVAVPCGLDLLGRIPH